MTDEEDEQELLEKRFELRQKLKSQLLTLAPSSETCHCFHPFIPNARDNEFLEKHGLDCVLNYLIVESAETDDRTSSPNICDHCRVDATENWWRRTNERLFLCDQCEQKRMRQLILQQHRESMKSAFLQAKETERRLSQVKRKTKSPN